VTAADGSEKSASSFGATLLVRPMIVSKRPTGGSGAVVELTLELVELRQALLEARVSREE
jgi:hypothetical protein